MFPKELINVHAQKSPVRTFAIGMDRGVKYFDEYYQKLGKEDPAGLFNVEFFTYFTYEVDRDGGRTLLQGMIQFKEKTQVADAKKWFRTTDGVDVEPDIFRPAPRPDDLYLYIGKRQREVENGRQFTFGKFEWNRDREYVKKAMFKYFLNGGEKVALLDHFSLMEILDVPVNRIQEEAQIHKEWLKSKEQKTKVAKTLQGTAEKGTQTLDLWPFF